MNLQSALASLAVGLSVLHFLRGAYRDLARSRSRSGGACGTCSSGGCPAARRG